MSATKIILKRSSILGKRPNSTVLEAGEIALNTNSNDPGLFFETNTGSVVKVGPSAVSPVAPLKTPELGETWFNTDGGTFNIGSLEEAKKIWRSIASPFLGGGGKTVFVAPEFPFSTDSISNNGEALPFQTLTRAILELSKKHIVNILSGELPSGGGSSTIYFAPSQLTVNNEPGINRDGLSVGPQGQGFPEGGYTPTIKDLIQFNPETGGVILPSGISLIGMDLKKCEMRPTYVPSYLNPVMALGGVDAPVTSVLKWSGNSYLEGFSVLDKIGFRQTFKVTEGEDGNSAVFNCSRPHGLTSSERVSVTYAADVNQAERPFSPGVYYAAPIDTFTFRLVDIPFEEITPALTFVTYSSVVPQGLTPVFRLNVSNELKSAHRLRLWQSASLGELAEYYEKVQTAFPTVFGGTVTPGLEIVTKGEYEIVGPTQALYPQNTASNTVKNSSAYANQVNLRSEYGMCGGEIDGTLVEGFRSAVVNSCTVVSLQKDPAAYEIYANFLVNNEQVLKWWPLAEATFYSIPTLERPESVANITVEQQLELLNSTAIDRIRYYYETIKDPGTDKSVGLTNTNRDFRHFAFRATNSGYIQAQSVYTVGPAVGVWALNGGYISLTNSTSNFGSVAFKAEGFTGIGSIGGANPNSRGFTFKGIQTPLALTRQQVEDNKNKSIYSLGSRIVNVRYDENDPGVQLVELSGEFLPCFILPFSLKPGTALWVSSLDCTYRGFFATDGGPTVIPNPGPCANVTLRLRASDSTIPSDPNLVQDLDIPYIRRFNDPREPSERSYSIVIENTSPQALAPSIGSVLRLDQTAQGLVTSTLRPNVQLDPGSLGGWGRVFTVDNVETANRGLSPNFNYVVGDTTQDSRYLVTVTTSDYSKPWQQDYNNPQGSYVTYQNKNWYAAENNIWESVYYGSISSSFGPTKIAPTEACSPFVTTSVLEKQELVEDTFQGSYANDPEATGSDSREYNKLSYFRGSTLPYTEFGSQHYFDEDDSSDSLGLVLKQQLTGKIATLVSAINANTVIQTEILPSAVSRYRPEIVRFSVLSSVNIPNPRQTVSILRLVKAAPSGIFPEKEEYLRVINLVGTTVEAIRLNSLNSSYPDPINQGTSTRPNWPAQTVVQICESNPLPSSSTYDPDWSNTKQAVLRFLEVMGYSKTALDAITKPLQPYYWGDRFIAYQNLPPSPDQPGYALTTAQWPLEFNQSSTIISNTHTWSFCGYPFYSRGLPKYQTNEISRKLSYDFLSTSLWGGRLTVTGINDKGELVSFGPQREAITAQYYEQDSPVVNAANQQIYEDQPFVEFPAQVTVYSADDISSQFNGITSSFELKKGGLPIPNSQLSAESLFVQLAAITQRPGTDYILVNNTIQFSQPPQAKTFCDIRIVTSEDNNKTLIVVPLTLTQPVDGSTSTFTMQSTLDIADLNVNQENTFVFLGGVEQIPGAGGSYTMQRISPTELSITFSENIPENTTVNIRAVCSGSFWESQGISPVSVYSLDSISPEFNALTQQKEFALTYNGLDVNPSLVTTFNTMVSVGGVMQLPEQSYVIENGVIKFSEAPVPGSTSNLRVITNSEFLPCVNSRGFTEGFLNWGPSVVLSLINEVSAIKEDLG